MKIALNNLSFPRKYKYTQKTNKAVMKPPLTMDNHKAFLITKRFIDEYKQSVAKTIQPIDTDKRINVSGIEPFPFADFISSISSVCFGIPIPLYILPYNIIICAFKRKLVLKRR